MLTTLASDQDATIFSDSNNHASIIDGCRLAKGRTVVYRTRDVDHLTSQITMKPSQSSQPIISDGVFSAEGDIAPGLGLAKIALESHAALIFDKSHAARVTGEHSHGTAGACGLDPVRDVTAFTGTFSKAFGAGGGGYIAGSVALMSEIKRAARFYIFNTGMHIAAVGAAIEGVERASEDTERRDRLRANTQRLRNCLTKIGFNLLGGETSITLILIGDEERARIYFARLSERGLVYGFSYRSTRRGALRLQPSANHTEADIDVACNILAEEAHGLHLFD